MDFRVRKPAGDIVERTFRQRASSRVNVVTERDKACRAVEEYGASSVSAGTLALCRGDDPRNAGSLATPAPRSEWPAKIKLMAMAAEPSDKGVGDTVERVLGSGAIKDWLKQALAGASCGCANRQAWLNERYPYSAT